MSPQLRQIEEKALLLPPGEREILLQSLVYSLDRAPVTEVDEVWIQEAEKRYLNDKKGITKGIPGERIFAKIRQELGW